uniref:Uncharacterized protein n=1 Tax=Panagrolaimus sp. JU765 TaxID=591449 RepID=A0AC34PZ05_9BILA
MIAVDNVNDLTDVLQTYHASNAVEFQMLKGLDSSTWGNFVNERTAEQWSASLYQMSKVVIIGTWKLPIFTDLCSSFLAVRNVTLLDCIVNGVGVPLRSVIAAIVHNAVELTDAVIYPAKLGAPDIVTAFFAIADHGIQSMMRLRMILHQWPTIHDFGRVSSIFVNAPRYALFEFIFNVNVGNEQNFLLDEGFQLIHQNRKYFQTNGTSTDYVVYTKNYDTVNVCIWIKK